MEPARDLVQRPLKLPQQVHRAAEGLGHHDPLSAQLLDLALERTEVPAGLAQVPAGLAELSAKPLALYPAFATPAE